MFSLKRFLRPERSILRKIESHYYGNDGFIIAKEIRESLGLDPMAFVYGEVCAHSFYDLLKFVAPINGDILYDLGAGAGKAMATAKIMFPEVDVRGVELLGPMRDLSSELFATLVDTLSLDLRAHFNQGDIYEYDFSDASIVFINATGYFDEAYIKLVRSLERLKPGTRILISSKELPEPDFIFETRWPAVEMSWGHCQVRYYRRA